MQKNLTQSIVSGRDSVEQALKTSCLKSETALKMTHHQSSVEECFVDSLLDLSNGFAGDEIEQLDEHPHGINSENPRSVSPLKQLEKMEPKNDDFGSLLGAELNVQGNGLDNLEWLAQFAEENSCLEYPPADLAGKLPVENQSVKEKPVQPKLFFNTQIPTKPRTKRARTGGRVWSLRAVPLPGNSTSSVSLSLSSATTKSFGLGQTVESNVGKPTGSKRRKTTAERLGGGVQQRKCSHCGVQKTPQWRAGPMGAKTLCNACGVRFKSGRLFPEYRPACSPTFSRELHSNNHRKVLEMRQKKEVETGGLAPPVRNF
ncbi:hypothetical protein HAX54_047517 [Datura stramonium]|uniref:GATA transcription factor n=1 Tax=Datura stramonium TaxID=4076 RepID=A0ABS8SU25_DATST|nr:hypothetical protein [Datura stramonium]